MYLGKGMYVYKLNLMLRFCVQLHLSLESCVCSLLENGQTYVRDTGCISLLLQLFR